MTDINKIGIIGAGLMGSGIAHVSAVAGYEVILNDVAPESLERAQASIAKNMARQVKKEQLTPADADAAIARITTSTDKSEFASCELVIEAATENEAIKVQDI